MTMQLRQLAKYVAAFSLLFLLVPTYVSAAPADDVSAPTVASHCRRTYDGKTFVKGTNKAKEFNNSGCNDAKYCTKENVKKGGEEAFKITCKGGSPAPSDDTVDDKDSSETSADPALACSRGDCDIIKNYVNPAITLMTILVGLAVVGGIIWGAIQVITSAGDPQKAASGKDHIRNAVIAVIAYVFLWAFLQWVIPGGFI